jgi:hypothetical protein
MSTDGDPAPFLDFMGRLIPDESDRNETLRWCATLIARPATRMTYSLLLVSIKHGTGKSTLAEKTVAPLVGIHNACFPTEAMILDANFNSWRAHKQLAVVHEIYQGHSRKAYDTLKVHRRRQGWHRKQCCPLPRMCSSTRSCNVRSAGTVAQCVLIACETLWPAELHRLGAGKQISREVRRQLRQ